MSQPYQKLPLSVSDQIIKLKSKKLLFKNEADAEQFLLNNGYYRVSGYAFSFRNQNSPMNYFKKNAHFEDIVSLYQFDSNFRSFILNAIEKIEISFRAQIVNQYSMVYGSHWNSDSTLFKINKEHSNYLADIDAFIFNCNDDFIKHYKTKYNSPKRPPSWMCFEIMSFGQVLSLYQNLDDSKKCKIDIAKYFGLMKTKDLIQWMRAFRIIRNICAHHGRLWNKSIPANVWLNPQNMLNPFITIYPQNPNRNKIYASICCIQYLLNIIEPANTFGSDLKIIMQQKSQNESKAMGFPTGWENEVFWS